MRDVASVTQVMAENMAVVPNKRVRLDFGEDGHILLDGIQQRVSTENGPADATVKVSFADFLAMADGTLNGTMAFMQGKLKVEGDMSAAMQLQSVTSKIRP
jgi:putative sterol carrier protein